MTGAAEKRKRILSEINCAHQIYSDLSTEKPLSEMTEKELKEKLKSLGVSTRVRKREKLIELINKHQDNPA